MRNVLLSQFQNIKLIANVEEGAEFLSRGGLLVYPTETFLALGCLPTYKNAITAIYDIKNRGSAKPLPMLGSDLENIAKISDMTNFPFSLAETFWPGPLTLLLPAKGELHPLQNSNGKIAIRLTSHPKARRVAFFCGLPIISTSANIAGESPAQFPASLSCSFLSACNQSSFKVGFALWTDLPVLKNQLPSTIVEPVSQGMLILHREGAISKTMLENHNYEVHSKPVF